jgi:hypothetical protein
MFLFIDYVEVSHSCYMSVMHYIRARLGINANLIGIYPKFPNCSSYGMTFHEPPFPQLHEDFAVLQHREVQ